MEKSIIYQTYKLPDSYEKRFVKSVRPKGIYLNFPDFFRDAVREKLEREEKN